MLMYPVNGRLQRIEILKQILLYAGKNIYYGNFKMLKIA
jgi:hypothetical protein